jgi:hypothetical protein
LSLIANASESQHPDNCTCVLCRIYRASRAFDQAALLFDDLLISSSPEQANAPYRPGKTRPLLVFHQAIIGLNAATSTYIYRWNIPGVDEGRDHFIEVPALFQDELF